MINKEVLMNQGFNLINLIKALLNDSRPELKDVNFKYVYQLAKLHSLQNILYYAINHYQSYGYKDVNVDVLKQLTKDHQFAIMKTAAQEAELELIEEKLEENKIDYCVLKGSVLKNLYPSIDMRSMADIDIYFNKLKVKDVKKLMIQLGYTVKTYKKSNHDCYMKDPFMNLEMHRELVHDRYEFSKYYDNYFEKLIKVDDKAHKYVFKEEDYYLYLIAHSAKHCASGGTGIRTVIDQYIYLENKKDKLDRNYIDEELKKLGLALYEKNITNLAYYWFGTSVIQENKRNKDNDLMIKMSNFIFGSTTYGTIQNSIMNDFIGEEEIKDLRASKIKNLFKMAFPPYKKMIKIFPILKKLPFLLPFFYVFRLVRALFTRRDVIKSHYENNKKVTVEQIEEHKKTKEEMGI